MLGNFAQQSLPLSDSVKLSVQLVNGKRANVVVRACVCCICLDKAVPYSYHICPASAPAPSTLVQLIRIVQAIVVLFLGQTESTIMRVLRHLLYPTLW